MNRIAWIGLFLCGIWQTGKAQVELPLNFVNQLVDFELEFATPLENTYKALPSQENELLTSSFAMRSRREKMEIRYYLEPETADLGQAGVPHVHATRLLLHLASNDEEGVITGHSLPDVQVQNDFGADWAKMFHFQPKDSFSSYPHCRMLALYREGIGMAYVFFLFDEADRELENRMLALRFRPKSEQ